MHAAVMVSLKKSNYVRGQRTRDPAANRTGKICPFSVSACCNFRWTEHEAERTSWKRRSSMECIYQAKDRAPTVCLGRVERSRGCTVKPTPRAQSEGDEVAAAKYPIAQRGGERPTASAACSAQ